MKKVVIFDWGGIVESHENDSQDIKDALVRLIKRFNNSLSDIEILKRWTDETSLGVSIGVISDEYNLRDWFSLLQKNMNISVSFEEFKKSYEEELSLVDYYDDVATYAHSLKDRCKIAILSNLMMFDKKRIDKQYNLSAFDYVYLSYEIGLLKPDKKIYEYVLNDLNVSSNDVLLIDDDTNNILSARECGWNTCQAFGYELDKIKYSVEQFLNKK